jgi:ABC-type branched-subunit amino acid transport system substrate-binding protein
VNYRFLTILALGTVALVGGVVGGEPAARPQKSGATREVYRDGRKVPLEYAGPGREAPDPAGLAEVRIGYFGPSDPKHPEGGDLWVAAQLAIEEANRQGGYHGRPFRLMAGWSDNPWTAGASHVTRMVFVDKVWAVVGGIDGPSTHLAEQVATKALVPIVSPASTDRSANSAFVPWMFSCLPGDDRLAPLVSDQIVRDKVQESFAVVSADDHDSRVFHAQLTGAFRQRKIAPRREFVYALAPGDPIPIVDRLKEADPKAVVLLAGPAASARLVVALRQAGYQGKIFGGPWMGRRLFAEHAGRAADGVFFPLLYAPSEGRNELLAGFSGRVHREPDYAAAATYDAVSLVVAAVREAGLNRARIGDALRALSPWKGVSGTIRWDALGGNARPVALATIRDGHPIPLPAK